MGIKVIVHEWMAGKVEESASYFTDRQKGITREVSRIGAHISATVPPWVFSEIRSSLGRYASPGGRREMGIFAPGTDGQFLPWKLAEVRQ